MRWTVHLDCFARDSCARPLPCFAARALGLRSSAVLVLRQPASPCARPLRPAPALDLAMLCRPGPRGRSGANTSQALDQSQFCAQRSELHMPCLSAPRLFMRSPALLDRFDARLSPLLLGYSCAQLRQRLTTLALCGLGCPAARRVQRSLALGHSGARPLWRHTPCFCIYFSFMLQWFISSLPRSFIHVIFTSVD